MLMRDYGEYLLTKEIYDKARKGEIIPCGKNFYDGDSYIHIRCFESEPAKYCIQREGKINICLGYVRDYTLEQIRKLCTPSDKPLPSDKVEPDTTTPLENPPTESKLSDMEADAIAYELLMPEKAVRELADEGLSIEQMAATFYVDVPHMTLRVLQLFPHFRMV